MSDETKSVGKPPSRVSVKWDGEQRFTGGREHGIPITMDGRGVAGPSPVDTLLCALVGCTSIDVVEILAKRRTPVESLEISAVGARADTVPARITAIDIAYKMRGAGIERVHAERAIELAVTKYCSVGESLDPAIPIRWTLELES